MLGVIKKRRIEVQQGQCNDPRSCHSLGPMGTVLVRHAVKAHLSDEACAALLGGLQRHSTTEVALSGLADVHTFLVDGFLKVLTCRVRHTRQPRACTRHHVLSRIPPRRQKACC